MRTNLNLFVLLMFLSITCLLVCLYVLLYVFGRDMKINEVLWVWWLGYIKLVVVWHNQLVLFHIIFWITNIKHIFSSHRMRFSFHNIRYLISHIFFNGLRKIDSSYLYCVKYGKGTKIKSTGRRLDTNLAIPIYIYIMHNTA